MCRKTPIETLNAIVLPLPHLLKEVGKSYASNENHLSTPGLHFASRVTQVWQKKGSKEKNGLK